MTLFQGTFKIIANIHKCGETLPQKIKNLSLFRWIFFLKKKGESLIGYYVFKKLCWQFFGKKKLIDYNTMMAKKNVAMIVKWYLIFKTIGRHNGHHWRVVWSIYVN